jgi:hypothetical protein
MHLLKLNLGAVLAKMRLAGSIGQLLVGPGKRVEKLASA